MYKKKSQITLHNMFVAKTQFISFCATLRNYYNVNTFQSSILLYDTNRKTILFLFEGSILLCSPFWANDCHCLLWGHSGRSNRTALTLGGEVCVPKGHFTRIRRMPTFLLSFQFGQGWKQTFQVQWQKNIRPSDCLHTEWNRMDGEIRRERPV